MDTQHDVALTSEIGDGITQIRLPMRGNPLRYVNGYLVDDEDGPVLIDCGWKTDDVFDALRAALAERGLTVAALRRVLITHHHFDHYGLAGTLRRHGAAGLVMHRLDFERARFFAVNRDEMDARANAWLERNGFAGTRDDAEAQIAARSELSEPTRYAADGDRIGRLVALWTPGHAPGHLCFADTRSGRMFTGDHVLDPITPHVGIWVEGRGDPLGDYLTSLEKVATYGAAGALPAHGEPFPDLAGRARAIVAHTYVREAVMLDALGDRVATAADVARAVPWTRRERSFASLTPFHQEFAVTETIAHLEHLCVRGVLARDADDVSIRYSRSA